MRSRARAWCSRARSPNGRLVEIIELQRPPVLRRLAVPSRVPLAPGTPASAVPRVHGRGDARAPGRRSDGAHRRRRRGAHGDDQQGLSRPQRATASFVTRNPPCGASFHGQLDRMTEAQIDDPESRRTGHPSGSGGALRVRRRRSHDTDDNGVRRQCQCNDRRCLAARVPRPAAGAHGSAEAGPGARAEPRRRQGAHRRRHPVAGDRLAQRRRRRQDRRSTPSRDGWSTPARAARTGARAAPSTC